MTRIQHKRISTLPEHVNQYGILTFYMMGVSPLCFRFVFRITTKKFY